RRQRQSVQQRDDKEPRVVRQTEHGKRGQHRAEHNPQRDGGASRHAATVVRSPRTEAISGGLWKRPSFMIASSRFLSSRIERSASGAPSTSSRSARYPSRSSPSSPPISMIWPPYFVADSSASIGVKPQCLTKYCKSIALVPCGAHAKPSSP